MKTSEEIKELLQNSQNSDWKNDAAYGRTEQLKRCIIILAEKVEKLEFMIDNGLGQEDMKNDITYPSGD